MPKVVKHAAGILLPLVVLAIVKLGVELSWWVLVYIYIGLVVGWLLDAVWAPLGDARISIQENEELTRQIDELAQQRQSAEIALEEIREENATLDGQLAALRAEKDELSSRLTEMTQIDVKRLQSTSQQQDRQLTKQSELIDLLKGELQTLRRSMEKLRNQASGSDRRVANLKQQVTDTTKALGKAEQRISLAQTAAEKQLEQTQRVSAQRDELQRKLNSLAPPSVQAEAHSSAHRQSSKSSAPNEIQQELAALRAEHAKLTTSHQTLREEHAALERDAVAAAEADEKEIARLQAKIEQLTAKLKDLRFQV